MAQVIHLSLPRFRAKAFRAGGLFLFLTSGLPVRGQEPIRVAVNIVNAGFTVRDARGALVDNLTQGDVQVFEDAVEQRIAFFARSADVPMTLGLIVDVSGS